MTLTENERLMTIARKFRDLRRDNPDLRAVKLLNRMHADGIDGTLEDVNKGELLLTSSPSVGTYTPGQIGKLVGASAAAIKALIADPPEGMPVIELASKKGVVSYYSLDADAFATWFDETQTGA